MMEDGDNKMGVTLLLLYKPYTEYIEGTAAILVAHIVS